MSLSFRKKSKKKIGQLHLNYLSIFFRKYVHHQRQKISSKKLEPSEIPRFWLIFQIPVGSKRGKNGPFFPNSRILCILSS